METFLALSLGLLLGALIGAYLMQHYLIKVFNSKAKEINVELEKAKDALIKQAGNLELIGSIKYRAKKAVEIFQLQQDLLGSLDQPSKNATYSRNKNTILSQIKELEEQKMDIYRSILADGVDSDMTVMTSTGEKKTMKLSEVIKLHDSGTQVPPPPQTDSQSTSAKVIKLVTNKKEEDESDETPKPSGPTIH